MRVIIQERYHSHSSHEMVYPKCTQYSFRRAFTAPPCIKLPLPHRHHHPHCHYFCQRKFPNINQGTVPRVSITPCCPSLMAIGFLNIHVHDIGLTTTGIVIRRHDGIITEAAGSNEGVAIENKICRVCIVSVCQHGSKSFFGHFSEWRKSRQSIHLLSASSIHSCSFSLSSFLSGRYSLYSLA